MDLETFSDLVARALESLPQEFKDRLENVQVDVEAWPSKDELIDAGLQAHEGDHLLGLYHGVPLTERTSSYMAFPDRITIYMEPILGVVGKDETRIADQVRRTVVHEIAHYYGIDDERLVDLGAY